jgi:hypothetical protein
MNRTDYATGFGCLFLILLIISPIWLVIVAGVFAPFWIAGLIVLAVIAVVRSWFTKKGSS